MTKEDVNVKDICPAARGAKNHQRILHQKTKLFYVGTNHICMDTRPSASNTTEALRRRDAEHVPADHGNIRGKLM
jgi:hypothetical protein